MGIDIHPTAPDEAQQRHPQVVGQSQAQVGGCRPRDDYGDISPGCLEHYLRGHSSAGEQHAVAGWHFVQDAFAEDFVYRVVPPDIFAEDQDPVPVAQCSAVNTAGSNKRTGAMLKLLHQGQDLTG